MLPDNIDLSLVKDVLVEPSVVASSVAPATQEAAASMPSLRLGKSAKGEKYFSWFPRTTSDILDQSYFDSVQADMTLLSYMVEMGMH